MSKSIGNHNTNGNINYSNQVPGMISVSNPANLSGTYWSSTEHTQPLPTSIGVIFIVVEHGNIVF